MPPANAAIMHVRCPGCGHPKVAIMKRGGEYFVRKHRMGTIKKSPNSEERCPYSRLKVPISIGMKVL